MEFFLNLAKSLLSFGSSLWVKMCKLAAVIINSTFGWYSGQPFSEETAGFILWGGGGFVVAVIVAAKIGFKGAYK